MSANKQHKTLKFQVGFLFRELLIPGDAVESPPGISSYCSGSLSAHRRNGVQIVIILLNILLTLLTAMLHPWAQQFGACLFHFFVTAEEGGVARAVLFIRYGLQVLHPGTLSWGQPIHNTLLE